MKYGDPNSWTMCTSCLKGEHACSGGCDCGRCNPPEPIEASYREVSLIEHLDRLAAAASERPWRSVAPYGSIITDGTSLNHMDEDNRRAYGGGLVCESVAPADREFICALVNAWPELKAALERAERLEALIGQAAILCGGSADGPIPCGRCAGCQLRGLAPASAERPKPPPDFWREVPCGHPSDPVGWLSPEGHWVCHCGHVLDPKHALPTMPGAPEPLVPCSKCGCVVLLAPAPAEEGSGG